MYEEEVSSFYADMFVVKRDTICLKINGKDFMMDEALLGRCCEYPLEK